jgi:hypothetical protein
LKTANKIPLVETLYFQLSATHTAAHMNKEVFLGNAESISRRYFSRNIVAAAAIALIHDDVATAEKIMPTSAVNLGPKPEGLSVADWEDVHTKYSNLLRVYGNRLSGPLRSRMVTHRRARYGSTVPKSPRMQGESDSS